VPLAHPPGHAQVDFGECIGVIGGARMKLRVFCFDQSDAKPSSTGTSLHLRFSAACRSRFM
jgi:hypothetical protein